MVIMIYLIVNLAEMRLVHIGVAIQINVMIILLNFVIFSLVKIYQELIHIL